MNLSRLFGLAIHQQNPVPHDGPAICNAFWNGIAGGLF